MLKAARGQVRVFSSSFNFSLGDFQYENLNIRIFLGLTPKNEMPHGIFFMHDIIFLIKVFTDS